MVQRALQLCAEMLIARGLPAERGHSGVIKKSREAGTMGCSGGAFLVLGYGNLLWITGCRVEEEKVGA